ncbi:hypothetical protein DP43_5460 [Burkholderia pseudomallei]|nr:hypothetical protein DP43_5460 [Burkholderia pseudomallei]
MLTAGCDTHSNCAAFDSEPVRMIAWKTSMWRRRMMGRERDGSSCVGHYRVSRPIAILCGPEGG